MRATLKKIHPINFVFLTVAGIVNACAVTLFLQAANLYDGGFSGTSMLLARITPLNISIFLLVLNFPLFLLGYKKLGLNFILYSLYAIAVFSLFSFLFESAFGIDFSNGSPITGKDMLLSAIFGGIISGIGSGLTIRFGGAIDGVEVLAVIFAKKIGMTVGTFVMSFNIILYIIAGAITKSWEAPLYSVIAYAVGLKSVDFIIEGFDKSKSAYIISNHPEKIADTIVEIFERGVTIINAEGYYSKKPKKIIYCVVNRFEVNKMKSIVTTIDPNAFVAITDVSDSMGSSLKFRRRKKKKLAVQPIVTERELNTLPEETLAELNSTVKAHEEQVLNASVLNELTTPSSVETENVLKSECDQQQAKPSKAETEDEIKDLQLEEISAAQSEEPAEESQEEKE